MDFENHEEFFRRVGDAGLHPTSWGECLFPVRVEDMYQFFKARMQAEALEAIATSLEKP